MMKTRGIAKGKAKAQEEYTFVGPGSAHMRIKNPAKPPEDQPILGSDRNMTPKRLKKLGDHLAGQWCWRKVEMVAAAAPAGEHGSLLKFFARAMDNKKKQPPPAPATSGSAGAGPSRRSSRHSPQVKYGPAKYSPQTPEGLTPSQRDGKVASILVSP